MHQFDYCPVCKNRNIINLKGFESLHLFKCADCRFVFDRRIPTEPELNDHYKQYSYSSLKPCSPQTIASYNSLLDYFDDFKQTGNILDVGCGQGDFLHAARKRGWKIYGSEYSDAAISLCHDRDIHVQQGALTAEMLQDDQFDVITSFEVIEHINNPNENFSLIHEKLRLGGLFYCTTPNFNAILRYLEKDSFPIICYPEHISFYTKTSLAHLAKKEGFSVKKLITTGVDIGRLKNQLRRSNAGLDRSEKRLAAKAQTDSFRAEVESSVLLGLVKKVANTLLSVTGKGDTLKAYLVKE